MIRSAFAVAVWLAATAGVARAGAVEEILATDRAFAAAAQARGTRSAFVEFAAPDATLFRAGVGPIKGHAAIDAALAADPPATLEWWPEAAEAAASGDLGYSWGYYRYTPREGKGGTGNYVSVWRRSDGQWKWVVDLGVPAPPKP
jgi:ketosteroid isomerase-like protein